MRLLAFAAPVLLAASSAFAQADGGPCILDGGTIDQQGKCDGNDAVFCSDATPANGSLVRMHCPALPMGGQTLANGSCDILDPIGAWCTFPPSTTCAFVDSSNTTFYMGCGTPTMDNVDFVCDLLDGCADVSSTPLTFSCLQTTPRCFGSHLRYDCTSWSQGATIDCAHENGVCDGTNNVCVDGVGGECDNILLTCASGLVCNGLTANALGHCRDPNAPVDAGSQPVDSGQPVHDAGQQLPDAGERDAGAFEDAGHVGGRDAGNTQGGEGEGAFGGEGEGGGTGVGLGDAPDAGDVAEKPLPSGCGCASDDATGSPASGALFAAGLGALAFVRRRR